MTGMLEGRVAFVTGAASGIGREIAEQLAREGAKVTLADKDEAGAEEYLDGLLEERFAATA